MEIYDSVMQDVLLTLFKGYGCLIGIVLLVLLIAFLFKKKINYKKVKIACLVIIGCIIFHLLFLAVPRIVDMRQDQYIVIEDATMLTETMNSIDGSFAVYGLGYVKEKSGDSITLTGIYLIDLPSDDRPYQEFNGTFVYAKYSRQIVYYKEN